MYVPDELKVNRFKVVKIPSNKDYFGRFGRAAMPDNLYSGDDPAPTPKRKTEILAEEWDEYQKTPVSDDNA